MNSVHYLRSVSILFLTLVLSSPSLFSQKQGADGDGRQRSQQNNGQNLTSEERLKRVNEMIQKNVIEMAEAVEIRGDQQEAFVKAQASYEVQVFKIRGQMQQVGRDRDKRMALVKQVQKAGTNTLKTMKGILDKDQLKTYQEKMKERQPQPGQRGGGGGQRGGGGGGGGGRGDN